MQDMSAIVAKQWDANGTIRKTVYKPFNEQMTGILRLMIKNRNRAI